MTTIQTFPFDKYGFDEIKKYHFGTNWPVVYIQEDGKEMYIGQTTSAYSRSRQHYENPNRSKLRNIHIISDEEFNMSAAYDFESLLIQYFSADGKFKLQNGNGGLIKHNYYEKEKYLAKLETVWLQLKDKNLVTSTLKDIENSDIFKYSPYKALTEDQLLIASELEKSIKNSEFSTHIVNGEPGTGKTVLALYLLKHLKDQVATKDLKMAIVVPMTGLRKTLSKVVQRIPGLGKEFIIGPSDVTKKNYDILIVDEAHRLSRRVNLANYPIYDAVNSELNLPKEATQLDWILKSSKSQILFYDKGQSIRPNDVRAHNFGQLKSLRYQLYSQLRVNGGMDYIKFIDDLLALKKPNLFQKQKYDFKLYDNLSNMISDVKKLNEEFSLSRVVAGYAWPWRTKKGKGDYDIEIDGLKLIWNSTTSDWVNSKNSINEIGCIHTIQGYDLNYVGVIIGPELSYDPTTNQLQINEKKYEDFNGKRSITEPNELKQYILNIYKTLLTRGVRGTYVYIVDDKLREKFKNLTA